MKEMTICFSKICIKKQLIHNQIIEALYFNDHPYTFIDEILTNEYTSFQQVVNLSQNKQNRFLVQSEMYMLLHHNIFFSNLFIQNNNP